MKTKIVRVSRKNPKRDMSVKEIVEAGWKWTGQKADGIKEK